MGLSSSKKKTAEEVRQAVKWFLQSRNRPALVGELALEAGSYWRLEEVESLLYQMMRDGEVRENEEGAWCMVQECPSSSVT